MFKLSEWAQLSSYDIGLKEGSNASHILVSIMAFRGDKFSIYAMYWIVKEV
jgi:hypothetical protein